MTEHLRFGVVTDQILPWPTLVERWQYFEALGFDSVWESDHFIQSSWSEYPNFEARTVLAGLAALTKRIRIGVLVTANTFRHPALLYAEARRAAQLQARADPADGQWLYSGCIFDVQRTSPDQQEASYLWAYGRVFRCDDVVTTGVVEPRWVSGRVNCAFTTALSATSPCACWTHTPAACPRHASDHSSAANVAGENCTSRASTGSQRSEAGSQLRPDRSRPVDSVPVAAG